MSYVIYNMAIMRYMVATSSYGIIRKAIQLQDAKIQRKREKDSRIPLLMSDKVMLISFSGILAIYVWPMFLYNDLKKAEIAWKGLSPSDYDMDVQKSHLSDYLFE